MLKNEQLHLWRCLESVQSTELSQQRPEFEFLYVQLRKPGHQLQLSWWVSHLWTLQSFPSKDEIHELMHNIKGWWTDTDIIHRDKRQQEALTSASLLRPSLVFLTHTHTHLWMFASSFQNRYQVVSGSSHSHFFTLIWVSLSQITVKGTSSSLVDHDSCFCW